MPLFNVLVREVHVSHRQVEAKTAEEAKRLVQDDEGDETYCEYSHTLDPDTWQVEGPFDSEGEPAKPTLKVVS